MFSLDVKSTIAGAVFALGASTFSASAVTINIAADNQPDLTGSITIDLAGDQTGLGTDEYRFSVDLTNDDNVTWTTSTITSFALIADPTASFVSSTGNYILGENDGVTLPPSATVFDFCLETDGNNNCTGGNPGLGTGEGETQSFDIIVAASGEPLFTGGALRWQQLDGGQSAKGECTIDCDPGTGPDPDPIPVPAGLPLMMTAIGIGAYMRKRARKSA